MRKLVLKSIFSLKWLSLAIILLVCLIYFILSSSAPLIDGQQVITTLNKSVVIERDALGVPTIRAKSRMDTAFALGYLHAQERFMQMDLLRRSAAGELSGLLGPQALAADRKVKLHRFRERAQQIYRHLPKHHYEVLLAYTNGVNIGLDNLAGEPFQYLFLRKKAWRWQVEDTLLCIFAMYFQLNDELGQYERSLAVMKDQLSQQWYDFLTVQGGQWDAALDNSSLPQANTQPGIPTDSWPELGMHQAELSASYQQLPLAGSNNWAVDASLTPYVSAMLANDMHLGLQVPNVWYRASWIQQDGHRITGITLPGMPAMVAGSNERIAWGLTNTYGDWDNVITLQTNEDQTRYRTEKGWQDFKIFSHVLPDKRGKGQEYLTIGTVWGPVIGSDHKGRLLAHQWIAYSPKAVNLNLLELEHSESVDEALTIAPQLGIPPQNLVVADKDGHIGWSVAGLIPRWPEEKNGTDEITAWRGFLAARDYPKLIDPDNHRIWTANNRLFAGEILDKVGFEGGDLGARAQQIRDGLLDRERFQEQDMLAIQLDNRALFLQRWRQLLADTINGSEKQAFQAMANILQKETDLQADSDSIAYVMVRQFRTIVINQSIGRVYDALEKKYPDHFKRASVDRMIEYPTWELVSQQPQHLVPESYGNWQEFLRTAAWQTYNELTSNGQEMLEHQNWARHNPVKISHLLSKAIPVLGLFLDMPDLPLDGDSNMPRVMAGNFGASMRMVVAPGQENQGIMHMPVGQSNHPFSPYYGLGHEDWAYGNATPFLPGPTKWKLELKALQ